MTFKRPPWLGPTPFDSYQEYAPAAKRVRDISDAWASIPWQVRGGNSLYDAHTNALRGVEADLEAMRQFYINLTTERLKS